MNPGGSPGPGPGLPHPPAVSRHRRRPEGVLRLSALHDPWSWATLGIFVVLAVFLIYPLFSLVLASLSGQEDTSFLGNYVRFFSFRYYWSSVVNSLFVSSLATAGALLVGLPMAYCLTRFRVPGAALLQTLATLPLISPTFIGAYAWILLLGRSGIITETLRKVGIDIPPIYGWPGIVLVFSLQFSPFVFLLVSGALRAVDASLEEAGLNLGSSGYRTFRTVILPLILPSVLSGALLVFMASLADFGTPMIIGENYRVLPTLAYGEFINELGGNPSMASTLSMLLVLCSTGVLLVQRFWVSRKTHAAACMRPIESIKLGFLPQSLVLLFCVSVITVSMLPLIVIFVSSFAKTVGPVMHPAFSLASYRRVLYLIPRAMSNTLFFSSLSTALGIMAGVIVAYLLVRRASPLKGILDALVMLPFALPGTVIGIALVAAFNRPPLLLTGTWLILVISYFVRRLPYSVRASVAILHQVHPSFEEASASLGASPRRTFLKIVVPLMVPGVISGAALAWVTTINELSSTVVLYQAAYATMSVSIYGQVFSNEFGSAAALASILLAVTFIPLFLINWRYRGARVGSIF